MTTWRPCATLATLQARAAIRDRIRTFFAERGVLEVDTPILQGGANLDHGVVPMSCNGRWIPTSPEHPLKRLVAAGYGDVWTLSPACRAGERGTRHQPEFRMLEWYRCGWDDARLAEETIAVLELATGLSGGAQRLSWRQAYLDVGIDPDAVVSQDGLSREERLDLILTERIEPRLGRGCWTILTDYPASGAAQARLRQDAAGRLVAARFEIYREGIELANGYHECVDAADLRSRHEHERAARGVDAPPLDARFHAMLADGFPDCAGVAIGFDRMIMLALALPDVAATMAFDWDRA